MKNSPAYNEYGLILKAMCDDGICLSGLNECSVKEDIRVWIQLPHGEKLTKTWYANTTKEQRLRQKEDFNNYVDKIKFIDNYWQLDVLCEKNGGI